jgi:hypothetical protein
MTNDEAEISSGIPGDLFVTRASSLIRHSTFKVSSFGINSPGEHQRTYLSMRLLHVPEREASRHIQMQRMAATISATQLTPIGIVWLPTMTWACLISRRRWPMAKMPKMMLATRNPVFGEFMSRFL